MPITKWHDPVEIYLASGDKIIVTGPSEAMIYLRENWPEEILSLPFVTARKACRAALVGHGSAEEARTKFIAAIKAAKARQN